MTQPPNAQGIYGVQWRHRDGSASKFSTFFPDRCSKQQVLNSIAYAATHPIACPATAPAGLGVAGIALARIRSNFVKRIMGRRLRSPEPDCAMVASTPPSPSDSNTFPQPRS
uniref:EndoU domain-containing protein n=1 Tax=Desertifilum tharense IPPAS B-1220 TaxID=1781255 RepID=A0ACD5H622_9CYAN